jgi:uncharacterized protein YjiS (DUF1127 family)
MPASSAEEDQVAASFSVFRLWLDCRRTQRELALFSERDLADLGLVRSDVTRAAAFRAAR